MANFAKLDENNVVTDVFYFDNSIFGDTDVEDEQVAINVLKSICGEDTIWVQTSASGRIRQRYAGVGMIYLPGLDVFTDPKSSDTPSWILNEEFFWVPPIPYPCVYNHEDPSTFFDWDEAKQQWVQST